MSKNSIYSPKIDNQDEFKKLPWPKGLTAYMLYLLGWVAVSAFLALNLTYFQIITSDSYINDTGNGAAMALGLAAFFYIAIFLCLLIQGLPVVLAWVLVFLRKKEALTLLKIISAFILAAAVIIGFGFTDVRLNLKNIPIDAHSRDAHYAALRYLSPLMGVLVAINAFGSLYIFRSAQVANFFGINDLGGGKEKGVGKEVPLIFTAITALLIMTIYKETNTLLSLTLYIKNSASDFFLFFQRHWIRYLIAFILPIGSFSAAIIGLAGLKKEMTAEGLLPAALAAISLLALTYLGFSVYDIVRFINGKYVASELFGCFVALLEAAAYIFLLIKIISRRKKNAEYSSLAQRMKNCGFTIEM